MERPGRATLQISILMRFLEVAVQNDAPESPRSNDLDPSHTFIPPDLFITVPLHNHTHRFVIIALHLEVGYATISLSGSDPRVAKQILDCYEIGIRVEKLRGHGVP